MLDEESVDVALSHGRVDVLLLQQRSASLDRGLCSGLGRVRPLVSHKPRDKVDLPQNGGHFRLGDVCTSLETLRAEEKLICHALPSLHS